MKITEILKKKKPVFSCEFFPPKTEEGMDQLFGTIAEFRALGPAFVSVTYGAGGGTRDKTIGIASRVKKEMGLETMAHLTCVGHSRAEIRSILDRLRSEWVENLIALRGDPPKGESSFVPHPDGFRYAGELVEFARTGYDFCVAVAGYPEGHVEAPDRETDWKRLDGKIAQGGEVVITQLFFDNAEFFAFDRRMKAKGAEVPILPGIMPITNFSQIEKFAKMCGAKIPAEVARALEPVKEDLEAVQDYGVRYAVRQCEELIRKGVSGVHFYTLNKTRSTRAIVLELKKKGLLA